MKVAHLPQLARHLGTGWMVSRAMYGLRLRAGVMRRRMPAKSWDEQPLESFLRDEMKPLATGENGDSGAENYLAHRKKNAPQFFFSPENRENFRAHFSRFDENAGNENPVALAEKIARGEFRFFENETAQIGFPPDWHRNVFTGQQTPRALHWSEISDFGGGDIKVIWEPSRFGFAFTLVRAFWRTGDEKFAELFWQLVENWREENPPQLGANWKCGQEISFRVMAWCFALYGFLDAAATTAERVKKLAQMIAVSGQRIAANLDYALQQRNNHGISEGAGLWTIGVLFPEFRDAQKWRETGRRVLETQGRELIYDDGSFSQHSVNYHRVMLHDFIWSLRLGELCGESFSSELRERVTRATEWLFQLTDVKNGDAPCYGQNDGALILPLNNCFYRDHRAVVQAGHFLTKKTRAFSSGAWDEDLLWLFGADALDFEKLPRRESEKTRGDFVAETGGYFTLHSAESFVFTRCGTFHDRPGQADMTHVDLWWRGEAIALDAGTFSYNAPKPWNNSLSRTAFHNTLTVDGRDQMEQAGKFLWLPWLRGCVRCAPQKLPNMATYFEIEHDGFQRLAAPVCYRRAIVRLGDDAWLVLDFAESAQPHEYRLHWLLCDAPHEWDAANRRVALHTNAGDFHIACGVFSDAQKCAASLVRADENSPRGWRSRFYQSREPALSLALLQNASTSFFWTIFSPEKCEVEVKENELAIRSAKIHAAIHLQKNLQKQNALTLVTAITKNDQLCKIAPPQNSAK